MSVQLLQEFDFSQQLSCFIQAWSQGIAHLKSITPPDVFLQTVLAGLTGGGPAGRAERGASSWPGELTGLMCSCLRPLMPPAISCTTRSCDLRDRKSPDTCRRKLYFNSTPLGLKMTLSALWGWGWWWWASLLVLQLTFFYINCERQVYH